MHSSSLQDSDKNLAVKSEIYYTNEDVQFLHEVVAHAQELLPGLPERERVPTNALFTAYYALLPNIGVDADHDSRYARILFRIGGTRSPSSLFEKFEIVLSQIGIDLEFGQDFNEDGHRDTADERMDQVLSLQAENSQSDIAVPHPLRGRQRRKSESSVWDTGIYAQAGQHSRTHSQSAYVQPGPGIFGTGRRMSIPSAVDAGDNISQELRHGVREQGHIRDLQPRLTLGQYHNSFPDSPGSTHNSMRIRRRSPQHSEIDSKTTSTWHGSNDEDAALASLGQTAPTSKTADSDTGYFHFPVRNSEALVEMKISLLDQYRAKNLSRQALTQWRWATLHIQEDNRNLELLASHQDKQILVRQAFDSWQASLRTRQQAAETGMFFSHLEGRADRARNYMILSKAFLHWAASAYDESLRTSVARRHILRIRYFEAWRGLTAVNELKVRRQVLKKFFAVWHDRYSGSNSNGAKGIALFEENLAHSVFLAWLRILHEREASTWCVQRIKRSNFTDWVKATEGIVLNDSRALNHYHRKVKTSALLSWAAKSRQDVQNGLDAYEHRKGTLGNRVLQQFGLEYSLCFPARRLNALVSLRLKRNYIAIWLGRTRQETCAAAIDHLKIKREAWIAWKYKVRCHIIKAHIHRRLLLRGFRAWMLSERVILSQRLLDRRLAQNSMCAVAAKSRALIDDEIRDFHIISEFSYQKLTTKAVVAWRARWQVQVQQQKTASDLNSPGLLGDNLARWTARVMQHTNLQKWARDGEFYFLANKTLKLWKDAAEKSKREKRRIAYVSIRRKRKLNLATGVLSHWRRQNNGLIDFDRFAAEFLDSKTVNLGVGLFDLWRARTEEIGNLDLTGRQIRLKKGFDKVKSSFSSRQDLEGEAVALISEHKLALGIKMWVRAALHLRASQHVLSELREMNSRKTLRRIIIHWRRRTSDNIPLSKLDEQDTGLGFDEATFGVTERAEAWSEFGVDHDVGEWEREFDDENTGVTIPGYLSTPSKRISRARTFGKISSTTPLGRLSTPFEKHLRAQYSGGSLTFRRTTERSLHSKDMAATDKIAPADRSLHPEMKS